MRRELAAKRLEQRAGHVAGVRAKGADIGVAALLGLGEAQGACPIRETDERLWPQLRGIFKASGETRTLKSTSPSPGRGLRRVRVVEAS